MTRRLTEGERRLLTHLSMFGDKGRPIKKVGCGWCWGSEGYVIKGPPVVFKTKREATVSFEAYLDVLYEAKRVECFERAFADLVARRVAMGMTEEEATAHAHETVRLLREEEAACGPGVG